MLISNILKIEKYIIKDIVFENNLIYAVLIEDFDHDKL
tara:strand:+ start:88 stop:201 length:114 start_codon:yes stop_codon:yes gene_type:complete